jgi:glutathione synthase/RimK-type ligase-like ATP-grasp enzyme
MKSVFIVTHRRGFEADPVIDALRHDDIPVFRFNCDAGDEASQISFVINNNRIDILFACDNREINSSDIGVGWCQQLPPYLSQASSVLENLQRKNLWAAQFASFDSLNVPWFNSPRNILYASNKPTQLVLAQSIGFNIPSTLISNVSKDIRFFAGNQSTIAKNLATPWIVSGAETQAAYTRIVESNWLQNDNELEFCPVIYQEFKTRKKDYRVVVVGEQIFAAYCEPTSEQHEDIRRNVSTGESFQICEFDAQATALLKTLMKKLSIEYCSADFMEDGDENLYFLEINTCGAWWWVDCLYDGAIRNAIVKYFKQSSILDK